MTILIYNSNFGYILFLKHLPMIHNLMNANKSSSPKVASAVNQAHNNNFFFLLNIMETIYYMQYPYKSQLCH